MDVPHVLNDIEIRQGLKGYKEKSSTISYKVDVVGLSVFIESSVYIVVNN